MAQFRWLSTARRLSNAELCKWLFQLSSDLIKRDSNAIYSKEPTFGPGGDCPGGACPGCHADEAPRMLSATALSFLDLLFWQTKDVSLLFIVNCRLLQFILFIPPPLRPSRKLELDVNVRLSFKSGKNSWRQSLVLFSLGRTNSSPKTILFYTCFLREIQGIWICFREFLLNVLGVKKRG